MSKKVLTFEESGKFDVLLETMELIKSGYAGVNEKGTIVDRRTFPGAVPIKKNTMLGVPEPKKL